MMYRCKASKAEVLELYDEEIEEIFKEIKRQMDLDDLRMQEALFEHSNLVQDPKGKGRRKKLRDIKAKRAKLEEKLRYSWLGRNRSERYSRRSGQMPSSSLQRSKKPR
jgi:hypothetical protein